MLSSLVVGLELRSNTVVQLSALSDTSSLYSTMFCCSQEISTVSKVVVVPKSTCSHLGAVPALSALVAQRVLELPSTALSAVKLVPDSTSLAVAVLFRARLVSAAA